MGKTIFSKIIDREIPSYIVAENDRFIAFLDINPLAIGHTLIVPKEPVDYFFDVDDRTLSDMIIFSKQVAAAIKKTVICKRVGVAVIGFEVPHAHLHLVPMNQMGDINFANQKLHLSKEEFEKTARNIKENIS